MMTPLQARDAIHSGVTVDDRSLLRAKLDAIEIRLVCEVIVSRQDVKVDVGATDHITLRLAGREYGPMDEATATGFIRGLSVVRPTALGSIR